jgi:hypothetical protein
MPPEHQGPAKALENLGATTNMHKAFIGVALGATLALVLAKTLAGILNTVLSPLGLTIS